jgi:hypothetical protein
VSDVAWFTRRRDVMLCPQSYIEWYISTRPFWSSLMVCSRVLLLVLGRLGLA